MTLLYLLFIPVLVGLAGLVFFGRNITWKEFLLQECITVLIIGIGFGISIHMNTTDVEIWSGRIADKEKKTVSCSESYSCNCRTVCSGSGESRSCGTQCDTCWRYWTITNWSAYTTNGESAYSAGSCHNDKPFEPKRYTEIIIGEPTAIEHSYTNYIKAAKYSVLKRTDIEKEFNIPDYPGVYDHYRIARLLSVGYDAGLFSAEDNALLDELNADIGSKKEVNISLLVVKEHDQLYVEKLREEWLGGKKNDFIVIVGSPEYPQIAWADVVSWSDSEDAKVFTKNRIIELGAFDLGAVLGIVREEVEEKYVRKPMSDFDYLKAQIEPSPLAMIILFVVGLVSSIGMTILFKHKNVV